MGICEVLSAPRSPWQRAYIERVIGSIRRECLDHVIVFQESSLRRTLHSYFEYYYPSRTHLSLAKDSPEPRAIQPPEMGSWRYRRLVDYITATNDGPRERARTYNATGCLCSTVWNPSAKCPSLHTRVSARVEQVHELRELRFNSGNCISGKVARDFR
jgi:hypothetical protein